MDLSGNALLLLDEEVFRDVRQLQQFSCARCRLAQFRVRGFSLRLLRTLNLPHNHICSWDHLEPHLLRGLQVRLFI